MRISSPGRLLAGALVTLVAACSFGPICPIELFPCYESADMKFEGQESLEAGTYTLEVKTEEGETTCTAVLDDGGIFVGAEDSDAMGGEGGQPAFIRLCKGANGHDMTFSTDEEGRIDTIGFRGSPDSLELTISRDGTLVLLTTVEFQYPKPEEGCTKAPCRQATETVVIE